MTQGRSDDGAQAAQRRAETAGANSELNRRWLQDLMSDAASDEHAQCSPPPPADSGWNGTAQARDRAARMHDNAATMHERAVNLGIGDSDEHRRSAARHRDAATSHRPPSPPDDAAHPDHSGHAAHPDHSGHAAHPDHSGHASHPDHCGHADHDRRRDDAAPPDGPGAG